jgi:hypothetical protein
MLRLNRAQRTLLADTLRQAANIVFGGVVIGQLIGAEPASVSLAAEGIATWWVLVLAAVVMTAGKGFHD